MWLRESRSRHHHRRLIVIIILSRVRKPYNKISLQRLYPLYCRSRRAFSYIYLSATLLVAKYKAHRRRSRGGEGDCSPPVTEIFEIFRAKVLGRKYSKMLCTTRLEGYFLWRLPCQDSVKVKWSKDPGICFGKAMCRLHVYRRNPWDETRTDSKQTKTYNLGQNLLRHITKIPIFCTYPDKNAYSRKLKDRFPPHLLQCCLR